MSPDETDERYNVLGTIAYTETLILYVFILVLDYTTTRISVYATLEAIVESRNSKEYST